MSATISADVIGLREPEVNGFKNAAFDGNQLRGEAEFGFFEAAGHQNFGHVAMVQNRIGGEIFGHFAETVFEGWLCGPRR